MFWNSVIWLIGIACVKKDFYTAIVQCLRDAVRRKSRQKWRTSSRFLLHDNAPAYRSVLVKGFLTKKKQFENSGVSAGLFWSDSSWFLPVHSTDIPALDRRRFCDATAVMEGATEDLIRLSQNGFQECLQHLCSCWQKRIVAQWALLK